MLDGLDSLVATIGATYPEIELAHSSTYAGRCAEIDPARAQAYFDRAMEYYRTRYSERTRLSPLPTREWSNYDWMTDRTLNQAIARRYARLGFARLAFKYSKSGYFAPEW